jgi:phage repressor protein C with HTH and peptisase S24 domain
VERVNSQNDDDNADTKAMPKIGDRVRTERIARGMSQQALAKAAGMSQATLSALEIGKNIETRKIGTLARALGVNADWLATGIGPKSGAALPQLMPPTTASAFDLPERVKESDLVPIGAQMRQIAVVGTAQLGDGGLWVELEYPVGQGDGTVPFPTRDPNAYAVRCRGDSMSPRLQHGEFAVVEPSVDPAAGDEVLVKSHDGRVLVKRLKYVRDGRVHLESVNAADHPPIVIELTEVAAMHYVAGFVKSRMWRP